MNLQNEAQAVDDVERQIDVVSRSITAETEALEAAIEHLKHAQEAQEILQCLSKAVQQKVHNQIAKVVTSCLEAVFGEKAYAFKIQFEMKRGKTEAVLKFKRGEHEVDPLDASGGGMVNVAAFALRAACLIMHRPRLSPLLVLDEPFGHVSARYQDNIRTMLEKLSEDLGIQILFITHNERLETGKVIRL